MHCAITAHGYTMLAGWCDDVPEAEVRRRETLAASRADPPYQRPDETSLRRVRPIDIPDQDEARRWRDFDLPTMQEGAA